MERELCYLPEYAWPCCNRWQYIPFYLVSIGLFLFTYYVTVIPWGLFSPMDALHIFSSLSWHNINGFFSPNQKCPYLTVALMLFCLLLLICISTSGLIDVYVHLILISPPTAFSGCVSLILRHNIMYNFSCTYILKICFLVWFFFNYIFFSKLMWTYWVCGCLLRWSTWKGRLWC